MEENGCGKAIGEVDPSTLGKNNLVKINGCCCFVVVIYLLRLNLNDYDEHNFNELKRIILR